MRVKIVVQDPSWLTRVKSDGRDLLALLRDLLVLLREGVRRIGQLLCGMRGHDFQLQVQRRRLALHCRACGHTTAGWDLSDPTPKLSSSDRPHFLELLRKRS